MFKEEIPVVPVRHYGPKPKPDKKKSEEKAGKDDEKETQKKKSEEKVGKDDEEEA